MVRDRGRYPRPKANGVVHAAERQTLEMIADGASLKDVLTHLYNSIEVQVSPSVTTVLLMDPSAENGRFSFMAKRRTKVFRGSGGILRFVVLIVDCVPIRQHALMQDTRNQNAAPHLAVKHDMLAVLQPAQSRANLVTLPA